MVIYFAVLDFVAFELCELVNPRRSAQNHPLRCLHTDGYTAALFITTLTIYFTPIDSVAFKPVPLNFTVVTDVIFYFCEAAFVLHTNKNGPFDED